MMIAVLAERSDRGAGAVHRLLSRQVGPERVALIRPADLVRAQWSHRVSSAGEVASRVRLPDGRLLETSAVLNRLVSLPSLSRAASAKDRDYRLAEFHALVASWLLGLGRRVLGLTSAYGTALGALSPSAALTRAAEVGFAVAPRAQLTRGGLLGPPGPQQRHVPRVDWPGGAGAPVPMDVLPTLPVAGRILVVGERVSGPSRLATPARALAAALDASVLELSFGPGSLLLDVCTLPALDSTEAVRLVAEELLDRGSAS